MTTTAVQRLTSVEDAKRIILEHATPLGAEHVPLRDAVGRVLAQDLVATASLPPFDNSAMDGYAVRSGDTLTAASEQPVILQVVGEVAAGHVGDRVLGSGEAVKIMTGAPVPPGADSVVMLEEARLRSDGHQGRAEWPIPCGPGIPSPPRWRRLHRTRGASGRGERVEIFRPVAPGSHVRRAGEDIKAGETALKAGAAIRVQHLGLLAGLGCGVVAVSRRPSVAIVATGSELVGIDQPLSPGKIRNSNSLVLEALLRQLGIEPADVGTVVDERDLIRRRLEEAARCDVMLISGGVSVGAHDLVKRVLTELGMETLFWRVNMKPGKPLLAGRLQGKMVFGLPGNPISCVVGFLVFIAPFLRKAMGAQDFDEGVVRAQLTQPLCKKEPKTQFFTARLREDEGALVVTPTPQQGSGMLTSLAQANAFIVVPDQTMELAAGAVVDVLPLWGEECLR
ncbi:MAG: molybdopterin molybdotransferase MoeA [Candidatus Omnitrophica bacterium]|nr:molybdopterin molybdotransferase MoeA [Candidatus Omnitrophota bacterium]